MPLAFLQQTAQALQRSCTLLEQFLVPTPGHTPKCPIRTWNREACLSQPKGLGGGIHFHAMHLGRRVVTGQAQVYSMLA